MSVNINDTDVISVRKKFFNDTINLQHHGKYISYNGGSVQYYHIITLTLIMTKSLILIYKLTKNTFLKLRKM